MQHLSSTSLLRQTESEWLNQRPYQEPHNYSILISIIKYFTWENTFSSNKLKYTA